VAERGGAALCFCLRGYRGDACEVTVQEPFSEQSIMCFNNCTNRGICADGTCQCPRGFWGIDCAITRDENGRTTLAYHHAPTRHPPEAAAWPKVWVYPLPPPLATWQLLLHLGRGLHSSTFHLKLSRFQHKIYPRHPLIPPYSSLTPTTHPLNAPLVTQKALKLSRELDECKPLHLGHMLQDYSRREGFHFVEQMLRSSHRTLDRDVAAGDYTRPLLSST